MAKLAPKRETGTGILTWTNGRGTIGWSQFSIQPGDSDMAAAVRRRYDELTDQNGSIVITGFYRVT